MQKTFRRRHCYRIKQLKESIRNNKEANEGCQTFVSKILGYRIQLGLLQ